MPTSILGNVATKIPVTCASSNPLHTAASYCQRYYILNVPILPAECSYFLGNKNTEINYIACSGHYISMKHFRKPNCGLTSVINMVLPNVTAKRIDKRSPRMHLLEYPFLPEPCRSDDLTVLTPDCLLCQSLCLTVAW